jgi:hypothetical protein
MNAAEKGERYARIFRKAGVFFGKGKIARAVEVLKEGRTLADDLGDHKMAERFVREIETISASSEPPK